MRAMNMLGKAEEQVARPFSMFLSATR